MATYKLITCSRISKWQDTVSLTTLPKPTATKQTEILVRVAAAPVHDFEKDYIEGNFNFAPTEFPGGIGIEGAGEVVESGEHSGIKVGQRVHFLAPRMGSWAEYVLVDNAAFPAIPLPDEVNFEQGSQLASGPLTALGYFTDLAIPEGGYLVQTAAASEMGKFTIQYAKAKGIKTINIVRRNEQVAKLKELGADYVLNSEDGDLTEQILGIVGPNGAQYAVDTLGGKTAELGSRSKRIYVRIMDQKGQA